MNQRKEPARGSDRPADAWAVATIAASRIEARDRERRRTPAASCSNVGVEEVILVLLRGIVLRDHSILHARHVDEFEIAERDAGWRCQRQLLATRMLRLSMLRTPGVRIRFLADRLAAKASSGSGDNERVGPCL